MDLFDGAFMKEKSDLNQREAGRKTAPWSKDQSPLDRESKRQGKTTW